MFKSGIEIKTSYFKFLFNVCRFTDFGLRMLEPLIEMNVGFDNELGSYRKCISTCPVKNNTILLLCKQQKTHTHTILKLVLLQIKYKSRFTDHVHCLYFLCEIKQSIVFSTVCCKLTIYKSIHVFQVCVLNTYKFSLIPTSLHPIPRNSHLIYKRIILVECSSN